MNSMRVAVAGMTDRGVVRSDNQDQFFVGELTRSMRAAASSLSLEEHSQLMGSPRGYLLMVADGMGGHRAGNEASGLAIQYFIASILNRVRWLVPKDANDEELLIQDLKVMLHQAHREITRQSQLSDTLAGMGTTFTMAYVNWPRTYVVHAGDTRCYLYRRGILSLLTRDHTVAQQMMQSGRLDAGQVDRSPWSNVLLNALGAGAKEVFADITKVDMLEGDMLLLCSDGLNKHVDDARIEAVLSQDGSPQRICESLVNMAKEGGGTDNITVVAAIWESSPSETSMPIFHSTATSRNLFKNIAIPTEESDTLDDEGFHISTTEFNEHPTDPVVEGGNG